MPTQVSRALTMVAPEKLAGVVDSPAVAMLPPEERIRVAAKLDRSRDQAEIARLMLQPMLFDSGLETDEQKDVKQALALALIALGMFSKALEVIRSQEPELDRMEIQFAFNYGMALWGDGGQLVREPFQRVVELKAPDDSTPNYLQCVSLSHWVCGDATTAREYAAAAQQEMSRRRGSEFSCWRYLRVPAAEFAQDVSEMLDLIGGDDSVKPRFLSQPDRRAAV